MLICASGKCFENASLHSCKDRSHQWLSDPRRTPLYWFCLPASPNRADCSLGGVFESAHMSVERTSCRAASRCFWCSHKLVLWCVAHWHIHISPISTLRFCLCQSMYWCKTWVGKRYVCGIELQLESSLCLFLLFQNIFRLFEQHMFNQTNVWEIRKIRVWVNGFPEIPDFSKKSH